MKLLGDDQRLTAYALGELPAAQRAEVERLLADDPAARQALRQIRDSAALLETALDAEFALSAAGVTAPVPVAAAPVAAAPDDERLTRHLFHELVATETAALSAQLRNDADLCLELEHLRQVSRLLGEALHAEACPPLPQSVRHTVLREAARVAAATAAAAPPQRLPIAASLLAAAIQARSLFLLFLPSLLLVLPIWVGGGTLAGSVYRRLLPPEVPLPAVTQAVIRIGEWLQAHWLAMTAVCGLIVLLPWLYRLLPDGLRDDELEAESQLGTVSYAGIGKLTAVMAPALSLVLLAILCLPADRIQGISERGSAQELNETHTHLRTTPDATTPGRDH